MASYYYSGATTLKIIALFAGFLLFIGASGHCLGADELRLVIAPKSATLTAKGFIEFEAFIFNGTKKREEVPWPQNGFNVEWKLHDSCNIRPDRDGAYFVAGTDTVETVPLNPGKAKGCMLGAQFDSEPADVLEFYITIERKRNSGDVQSIRSNSVMLYRPK